MPIVNWFVDPASSGSNSGTTPDNAWTSIKDAIEYDQYNTTNTNIIWIRRNNSSSRFIETPTNDITPLVSGIPQNLIKFVGWPRNLTQITSATWIHGSNLVIDILGTTLIREKHIGRIITSPFGGKYLITKIDSETSLILDRPYSGPDVNAEAGAFVIEKDLEYDFRYQDSTSIIEWDSDSEEVPLLNFSNSSYYLNIQKSCLLFSNMEFKDGISEYGTIKIDKARGINFLRTIFTKTQNSTSILLNDCKTYFNQIIFEGNSTGNSQNAIYSTGSLEMANGAIYGYGNSGIIISNNITLNNVNLGVENGNMGYDIVCMYGGTVKAKDLSLGSTNKVGFENADTSSKVAIESYQKILNSHILWTPQGIIQKKDVMLESTEPIKRVDGSSSVLDIYFNNNDAINYTPNPDNSIINPIFVHEFNQSELAKSYKYYIQSEISLNSNQIWLEAEYIDTYDGENLYEYTNKVIRSTENIAARIDSSDWSQFLTVETIPDGPCRVRIKCYCNYNSDNHVYIDPAVEGKYYQTIVIGNAGGPTGEIPGYLE